MATAVATVVALALAAMVVEVDTAQVALGVEGDSEADLLEDLPVEAVMEAHTQQPVASHPRSPCLLRTPASRSLSRTCRGRRQTRTSSSSSRRRARSTRLRFCLSTADQRASVSFSLRQSQRQRRPLPSLAGESVQAVERMRN